MFTTSLVITLAVTPCTAFHLVPSTKLPQRLLFNSQPNNVPSDYHTSKRSSSSRGKSLKAFIGGSDIHDLFQLIASTSTTTYVPPTPPFSAAIEGARLETGLWLVGASGGAGIARSAFPRMYNQVTRTLDMGDVGSTKGGEELSLPISSYLCGLPRNLCKADINQVVNLKLTVEQMISKGPKNNYFATKGYLTFAAFEEAAKKNNCNPLTVRAVFDTLNANTDIVEPDRAQKKLNLYKSDPSCEILRNELLLSKAKGIFAILTLLFLLGLADVTAFSCASRGWFPDWPGTENLPAGLIDPGFWTIKDYWI